MTAGSAHLLERVRAATADEYVIDREIGRGGMAAVFLARDIALDRRVAIKVMLPDLINVQGVQDRFVIEARTAAHLDHPGIVTVYAVGQRAGLLYIVMKYIEGHTLEGVLRSQGRIDPTAVALIGSRVAEALSFAHGEGVVHRDVKPSNIMIDRRGRPVVTDFGIARVMTAQSITVAGSMLGTPTHMSPEQCRGLPATAASDQYALGVTMYEMLTGRVPFTGSLFELINAHREQSPPALSEFVGGVDAAMEQTVMRMLAKEPHERWGSMTDVVSRLAAHTAASHGSENMRATLVMSGSASHFTTPERPMGAVDVLTPPGSVRSPSGPPTPVSFGGPPSPVALSTPASISPEPAHSVSAMGAERGGKGQRGLIVGGLGILAAAVIVFAVARGGGSAGDSPASKVDSTPPAAIAVPAPSTAAPVVPNRDSLVRDSIARASAARDSIARDSVAKSLAARDSAIADSASRAAAARARAAATPRQPPVSRAARDTASALRIRPESIAVECARLLERVSLGERLTDAERALLRRRCPR